MDVKVKMPGVTIFAAQDYKPIRSYENYGHKEKGVSHSKMVRRNNNPTGDLSSGSNFEGKQLSFQGKYCER